MAVLRDLGGWATTTQLLRSTTRRELASAVEHGTVERCARGRYALPELAAPLRAAWRAGGVLAGPSAALHHGWSLLRPPEQVHLVLPPGRPDPQVPGTHVRRAPTSPTERRRLVTSPARTVLDCAARLPLVEGLAVADSALRTGALQEHELRDLATGYCGTGAVAARTVLPLADGRAANAFESALRGHLLQAGFRSFVPQLVVTGDGFFAQVDLGDPGRRVAIEADGYATHGGRRAFAKDLRRHDVLAALGWVTLRFAYEHVLGEPGWVVEQVRRVMARRRRTSHVRHAAPRRRTAS